MLTLSPYLLAGRHDQNALSFNDPLFAVKFERQVDRNWRLPSKARERVIKLHKQWKKFRQDGGTAEAIPKEFSDLMYVLGVSSEVATELNTAFCAKLDTLLGELSNMAASSFRNMWRGMHPSAGLSWVHGVSYLLTRSGASDPSMHYCGLGMLQTRIQCRLQTFSLICLATTPPQLWQLLRL